MTDDFLLAKLDLLSSPKSVASHSDSYMAALCESAASRLRFKDAAIGILDKRDSRLRAEIETLQAELARLRDATRWRSVGEELPEESGNYATWHPGEMPYARMYWADVRRFEGPTPTHWQPLPAPPAKEE